jgi:GTP-dependent phosphoenolpyruvate carboxykinase|tara:strand:+ start:374 stop:577 length:204 start_codon:yes stop_codon:yes gene_type:complete
MELEQILSNYIDKYGEEYDIDTVLLSDDAREELKNILEQSIQSNKPISLKELNDFLGYDPNDPEILI